MAISKKDARKVIATMRTMMSHALISNLLVALQELKISNKSFRKSLKRIGKMMEQPKAALKKAA